MAPTARHDRGNEAGRGPARAPYSVQRQQLILRTVRSSGQVDAGAVAAQLQVTSETVRKDLIALEGKGLLRRVHGGAVAVDGPSFEPDVSVRTEHATEKHRIARAAVAHVPLSGSILVDAGSTTLRLAALLPVDRVLTVYTSALSVAILLMDRPNLTVLTLGGRLRSRTSTAVGDWSVRHLAEVNVDVAFLGTNGISPERGLTTPDADEAAVKRAMLSCSRERVLLADSSKIGMVSAVKHGDLSDIDLLITDSGISPGQRAAVEAAGVRVLQA